MIIWDVIALAVPIIKADHIDLK